MTIRMYIDYKATPYLGYMAIEDQRKHILKIILAKLNGLDPQTAHQITRGKGVIVNTNNYTYGNVTSEDPTVNVTIYLNYRGKSVTLKWRY
jgi:hypothetical protein